MLSHEDNQLFTRFGPGTPMGELLRRYWNPVGASELVTNKPQRMKILGEELLLYRGQSGKAVVTQLRCAHRSLALDHGRVEGDNIRCAYHGWLYDATGQCLAQPAEPEGSGFKEKVKLKSYPTQEVSGLVFAYMGPGEAPVLPLYDVLLREDGMKGVQMRNVNCNWLNIIENVVDISHLAWLHGHTFPAYGAKKVSYHWDRKPYGVDNVMDIEGIDDTHTSCWAFPNVNRFAGPPVEEDGDIVHSMIYRIPMDDEQTMQFFVRFYKSDKRSFNTVRHAAKLGEYRKLDSDWWGIDVSDQDRMAVEQQGVIADRANEHLGASDGGIILQRKIFRDALADIAAGRDPLGVIRDPAKQYVELAFKSDMMKARTEGAHYGAGFAQAAAE
jgi:5,5'-dehydrodivanillate O-demethylase